MSATKQDPACPSWCTDHVRDHGIDYHLSKERRIHGHVVQVLGPGGDFDGGPGGIYFYESRFFEDAVSPVEARAKLAALQADIKARKAVAEALDRAIGELAEISPSAAEARR